MKIGVTGTRKAPTQEQLDAVRKFLNAAQTYCRENDDFLELHHGDCVGADAAVAAIAKEFGIKTVSHPPSKSDLRAFFESDETRYPTSYFARNRNVVDGTDFLLVVPYQTTPQTSGGTWYTHDYALKQGKAVKVIYPNV
jgi:hypothetical protein